MDKRLMAAVLATSASVGAWQRVSAALPAFPGAEGFGANAIGGRGNFNAATGRYTGDVYHVTSLADTLTPGTLRYGLRESGFPAGGRTIVFDVGGTIQLGSSTLDIKNISKVTIAGQTAPSPITLIGNTIQITGSSDRHTNDIILQHVNVRKGPGAGEDAISIKGSLGTGTTSNIIVDHVSGSWSLDEVISVTQRATNVTVQNSMMSEALTSDHAYGALIRPQIDSNVSYNRNLFSSQKSRNPRPGTYNGATLNFEFQNNVIYNWSDRAGYIAGADDDVQILNMNYAGNYLIAGPSAVGSTRRETAFYKEINADPLELHVWQQGNKIDANATPARDGTESGWAMFRTTGSVQGPFPDADKAGARFAFPADASDSADVAYAKAVASVGAFPWARGVTDQRLINDVIQYTGSAPIDAPPAGEWENITGAPTVARPTGWDSDNDGMPGWWETLRGFNPSVADNNDVTPDGYTRLEKYLHSLSAQATWNLDADGNWSGYLNWRGMRPGTSDATANFAAGITAPRTVQADLPVTIGQMRLDGEVGYTLAGAQTIAVDVFAGSAAIDVAGGSHAITAPLVLADATIFSVGPAGATLTIADLQPGSAAITKAGAGTLAVNRVRTGAVTIDGGKLKVLPDGSAAGVSRVGTLEIGAGAALDLTDNALITAMPAGSWNGSTYTGVAELVRAGRNGGAWDGAGGIVTSDLRAAGSGDFTTIGVAKVADIRHIAESDTTLFAGQTVLGSDTVAMFTYGGDANLDGQINIDDYGIIDANVGSSGSVFGWSKGDFNYDGKINVDDYGIIDSNIVKQGTLLLVTPSSSWSVRTAGDSAASVPEPAVGALLGGLGAALLGRQRR